MREKRAVSRQQWVTSRPGAIMLLLSLVLHRRDPTYWIIFIILHGTQWPYLSDIFPTFPLIQSSNLRSALDPHFDPHRCLANDCSVSHCHKLLNFSDITRPVVSASLLPSSCAPLNGSGWAIHFPTLEAATGTQHNELNISLTAL